MGESGLKPVTFLRVARQIIGIWGFEVPLWASSGVYRPLEYSGTLRHVDLGKHRGPDLVPVQYHTCCD